MSLVWAMFSNEWRTWWVWVVRRRDSRTCNVTIPRVTMQDITEDRDLFVEAFLSPPQGMKYTGWRFVDIMEKCITVPCVRCPWGCSE